MAGFKCYMNRWVDPATYNNDRDGVKACLEDLCNTFLADSAVHGWTLDTTNCPAGEAVLLTPSYGVYAMFFVHTSGARLMLALNYRGCSPKTNADTSITRGQYTVDCGFDPRRTNTMLYRSNTYIDPCTSASNASLLCIMQGGLMGSYIPPAKPGETQEVFDASVDMRTSAFFPTHATDLVCTSQTYTRYASNNKSAINNYNNSQSLIVTGNPNIYSVLSNFLTSSTTFGSSATAIKKYCILCNGVDFILTEQCREPNESNMPPSWCAFGGALTSLSIDSDYPSMSLMPMCYNIAVSPLMLRYGYSNSSSYTELHLCSWRRYSGGDTWHTNPAYTTPQINNLGSSNSIRPPQPFISSGYTFNFPMAFCNGLNIGKTIDNVYYHSLLPIAVTGGSDTVRAFFDPALFRVMRYDASIKSGTYLGNKDWLIMGYIMIENGQQYVYSTEPGWLENDEKSTYVHHFVIRWDNTNTDSPF